MAYKTIAVDFDKTLAEYESGTFEHSVVGNPIPGAIAFLKVLKRLGFTIIILSVRAETREGKEAIEKWVETYVPGVVSEVTNIKLPIIDVIVDDRAIHFDGDYKEVMKEIFRRTGE